MTNQTTCRTEHLYSYYYLLLQDCYCADTAPSPMDLGVDSFADHTCTLGQVAVSTTIYQHHQRVQVTLPRSVQIRSCIHLSHAQLRQLPTSEGNLCAGGMMDGTVR
jgi:hypothetical protein